MDIQNVIFFSTGGLGIFLYGMTRLSDGLQKLAGSRLRNFIRAFTSNRLKGLLVGAGVTSVIQSSSVTTVMLIGLLNAGVMTLKQSIGVVYGANIGTTITAQIIAFKITHYALPMIAVGFLMTLLSRSPKTQYVGQVLLSLGFIFLGLKFMKDAFAPLKSSHAVMEFCAGLSQQPVLAILIGTILTIIVQSSSASIGITIAMATTGLIDFTAALYIILGDNVGTTVTAWLASIGSSISARRMALVHSMFNVIGATYIGLLIHAGFYPRLVDFMTPGAVTTETIARHIANAHTLFNVFNAAVLFAAIPVFAWIAQKVFPGEEHGITGETKYLDPHLLDTPDIAVDQVGHEIHHMATVSSQAFEKACESFLQNDPKGYKEVSRLESAVDSLQQEITKYLVKIFGHSLSGDLSNRLPSLLHSVNDLEKISDYSENIAEATLKRRELNYPFSAEAVGEMREIYEQTRKMFNQTLILLETADPKLAKTVLIEEDAIDNLKRASLSHHIERLKNKKCHPMAGLGFMTFLNNVEKVADHLTNVTQAAVTRFAYLEKKYMPDADGNGENGAEGTAGVEAARTQTLTES